MSTYVKCLEEEKVKDKTIIKPWSYYLEESEGKIFKPRICVAQT
jgi:hypothetical protein